MPNEIQVGKGLKALVLTGDARTVLRPNCRRNKLEQLTKKITVKNLHRVVEWGAPRGKELW